MSTTDSILNAFCWMLIHSLWQGILAAALAGLVIILTPKAGVRFRYGLLVSVMTLFLLACGFTFFQQFDQQARVSPTSIPVKASDAFAVDQPLIQLPQGAETPFLQAMVHFLNANTFWIILIWSCCFLFKSVHLITGLRHVHQLRHRNIHQPGKHWQAELGRLGGLLGVRPIVRLLESERVTIPVTIGHLKPLILIPFGLLTSLSPEQAETVLLHELAHIRRKDYLVNLMQCLVETVFFFNPALLWLSAMIRDEREACCDDLVVAAAGNRKSYLEVLVLFQETQLQPLPLAMGLADRRMHLLNRVKRMLSKENQQLTSLEKILLVVALVGMTAFTFLPEPKSAPQKSKTATVMGQVDQKPAPVVQKTKPAQTVTAKPRQKALKKPLPSEAKPVPSVVIDTIRFEKTSFSSIRYDPTNERNTKNVTITAIDGTGKKYTISKINGEIAGLAIDDQPVAPNELSRYTELFQEVDRFFEERLDRKQKLINQRMAENEENYQRSQEELKRATAAKEKNRIEGKQSAFSKEKQRFSEKQERFSAQEKKQQTKEERVWFEQEKRQSLEKQKHPFRGKETTFSNSPINPKKRREFDHASIQPDVDRIHGIMADLVQEGIVGDTDNIEWFGLSDTELIVNGRKLSADLHEKLQKKYGIQRQYGLYYGPVQMSGTGFFLDRKDPSTPSKE